VILKGGKNIAISEGNNYTCRENKWNERDKRQGNTWTAREQAERIESRKRRGSDNKDQRQGERSSCKDEALGEKQGGREWVTRRSAYNKQNEHGAACGIKSRMREARRDDACSTHAGRLVSVLEKGKKKMEHR
jgi:hypothetical protein